LVPLLQWHLLAPLGLLHLLLRWALSVRWRRWHQLDLSLPKLH
jgi:hypothetical protein